MATLGEYLREVVRLNPASFRIVCPDHIASMLAGPLVEAFRRDAPSATFSVRPAYLDRALRAVRRQFTAP